MMREENSVEAEADEVCTCTGSAQGKGEVLEGEVVLSAAGHQCHDNHPPPTTGGIVESHCTNRDHYQQQL